MITWKIYRLLFKKISSFNSQNSLKLAPSERDRQDTPNIIKIPEALTGDEIQVFELLIFFFTEKSFLCED